MGQRAIRRVLAVPAVAAVVAAGAVTAPGPGAAAATGRTGTAASGSTTTGTSAGARVLATSTQQGRVSRLHLRRSTTSWAKPGAVGHGRAANLSEEGLQRYVNRSLSPRPKVTERNGVRTLAGAAASAVPSWVPNVTPTAISSARPGVQRSWRALGEVDNERFAGASFEPPDQGLCVGGGRVLELINVVAQIYGVRGARLAPAVSLNAFYGYPELFDPESETFGPLLTDPSCVFDPALGRFVATVLTLETDPETGNLTLENHLDIAVSKTADPRGGWNFYRINAIDDGTGGTPSHVGCPCIGDFPHLGTDANGLFITTNEYPWGDDPGVFGNNFNGAQLYALNKRALARGDANVAVVQFENTRLPATSGARMPGFALWPAQASGTHYAPGPGGRGAMYFLSSFAAEEAAPDTFTGHAAMVGLWAVVNTTSLRTSSPAPVLRGFGLPSQSYGVPPLSNQKAGPTPLGDCLQVQCLGDGEPYETNQEGGLDSSDSRMVTAWYVGGRVMGALDTAMNVAGNIQAGPAWFAVKPNATRSRVVSQGYLGARDNNLIYPAIATAPDGQGVMGMTLSGDDWFPSVAYVRWTPDGPGSTVNVASPGLAPEDGFCEYVTFNCAGTDPPTIRPRWGDYGAAVWDGRHLWIAHEYIGQRCSFETFAADPTCGGTRSYYGNFHTRIVRLAASW